jgi:hypothetical protein
MAFEDLFKVYPNKNAELRAAAKVAYEFGDTIAQEPSAGTSIGLNEHALKRQATYVDTMVGYIEALHKRPTPDMPYVHPTRFDIDLSRPYKQFTKDGIPINEDTELLAQYWMICAVEMAASQSAGMAGSLLDADYNRISNHLGVIKQFIEEMETREYPDLPETAFPGAELEVPGVKAK